MKENINLEQHPLTDLDCSCAVDVEANGRDDFFELFSSSGFDITDGSGNTKPSSASDFGERFLTNHKTGETEKSRINKIILFRKFPFKTLNRNHFNGKHHTLSSHI